MRSIGIHLRLNTTLVDLAGKAQRLGVQFFQCFFVLQATGKMIKLQEKDIQQFLVLRREYFTNLYLHGSYWINLASLGYNGMRAFQREITLAKRLEFTHMILHPGNAKGARRKVEGIDALARALNRIMKRETDIQIVLENTVHGKLTVGSDIRDFGLLLEKLTYPERIAFCVDTSHAYAYGYNIVNDFEQDAFIQLLDETMGIDRIKLIHLNDTKYKLGSGIDRHEIPGEGRIGKAALKRFILHPRLRAVPIVLELPIISEERQLEVLNMIRAWHE